MKTFNRVAFTLGLAATLLLTVLFLTDSISLGRLTVHGLVAVSLLAAGIALLLLENASRYIAVVGTICAWAGFLLLTASAYHFVDLGNVWHIGVSLLSISLVAAITNSLSASAHAFKWIGIVAASIVVAVLLAIMLFKPENRLVYIIGNIGLIVFSIVAIAGTFLRSKAQP